MVIYNKVNGGSKVVAFSIAVAAWGTSYLLGVFECDFPYLFGAGAQTPAVGGLVVAFGLWPCADVNCVAVLVGCEGAAHQCR